MRSAAGQWTETARPFPEREILGVLDHQGNLYAYPSFYDNALTGSIYYYKKLKGQTNFQTIQVPFPGHVNRIDLAFDQQDQMHIVYEKVNDQNQSTLEVYYTQVEVADQENNQFLRQTITIPQEMKNPTLSMRYLLDQRYKGSASGFEVTLTGDDGQPVKIYQDYSATGKWKHGWADLSAWSGQTVRITFTHHQAAGEWLSSLGLDEISVGSWDTPIISSVKIPSPLPIHYWQTEDISIVIDGQNFDAGVYVYLNDLAVPALYLDSKTLVFTLPNELLPGDYQLRVVNPDGKEALAIEKIALRIPTYFPVIQR